MDLGEVGLQNLGVSLRGVRLAPRHTRAHANEAAQENIIIVVATSREGRWLDTSPPDDSDVMAAPAAAGLRMEEELLDEKKRY